MKKSIITLALVAAAIFSLTSCDTDITCTYDDLKSVEAYYDKHGRIEGYDMTIKTADGEKHYAISQHTYKILSTGGMKGKRLLFESRHGEYNVRVNHERTESITLNN